MRQCGSYSLSTMYQPSLPVYPVFFEVFEVFEVQGSLPDGMAFPLDPSLDLLE
jgi:hypothetical protein